jgi:hypothetical protein
MSARLTPSQEDIQSMRNALLNIGVKLDPGEATPGLKLTTTECQA